VLLSADTSAMMFRTLLAPRTDQDAHRQWLADARYKNIDRGDEETSAPQPFRPSRRMWRLPRARVSRRGRNRPSISTSAPVRPHRGKRGLRAKPPMYSALGDSATALPALDVKSSDARIGEFTLGNAC
jgi:hypothetical protein